MLTRSKRENFVKWFDRIDDDFGRISRGKNSAVRSVASVEGFGREDVVDLCKHIESDLRDTFSVECGNAMDSSVISSASRHSWYVSFIIQNDKRVLDKFVKSLPVSEIPSPTGSLTHSNAVWVFIGQNHSRNYLDGRAEHTDSLSDADATWHCQTRGTNMVRSTIRKLMKMFDRKEDISWGTHRRIEMQRGDLLLIDTQLWWHHTKIPSTVEVIMSWSYARDIRLNRDENSMDKTILTNVGGVRIVIFHAECILTETSSDCSLDIQYAIACHWRWHWCRCGLHLRYQTSDFDFICYFFEQLLSKCFAYCVSSPLS